MSDYTSQSHLVKCPVCGTTSDDRSWPQSKLTNIDALDHRLRVLEAAHASFVAGMYTRVSGVEHSMDEVLNALKAFQDELRPFLEQAMTRGRTKPERSS